MSAETKILCIKDYLAMPETMQHYEILDGELIMPPAPTLYHQWINKKLRGKGKKASAVRREDELLIASFLATFGFRHFLTSHKTLRRWCTHTPFWPACDEGRQVWSLNLW